MRRPFLSLLLLAFILLAGCQKQRAYLTTANLINKTNKADLIVYETKGQLWLTDSSGSFNKPLTSAKILATNPSFSKDKKTVAFLYGNQKQLAFLDLTTEKVKLAQTEDGQDIINLDGFISWFPDNQRVAYSQKEANGSQTIYYYHLKFRRPVIFWTKEFDITDEFNPTVTNDGKYVAFIWRYQDEAGDYLQELWKIDTYSGQDLVKIVALAGKVNSVDQSPAGGKIVFALEEPEFPGATARVSNVYIQNKDGTKRKLLKRRAINPKFDFFGQRLLYQRGGKLWLLDLKSNHSRELTHISAVNTADW